MVKVAELATGVSTYIFPNPAENNVLVLHPAKKLSGRYQLNLVNGAGQTVFQSAVTAGATTAQLRIPVPGVKSGLYEVVLVGNEGKVFNEKVIVR